MNAKFKPIIYTILGIIVAAYSFFWALGNPSLVGLSLESSFELSPESRFPRWFSIPQGFNRKDLTVKIYYYSPIPPYTYDIKTELLGPSPEFCLLDRKTGKHRWHPDSERRGYQSNPGYVIASVNGIKEVIEHKAMGPIFYISDDPKLIDEMNQTK